MEIHEGVEFGERKSHAPIFFFYSLLAGARRVGQATEGPDARLRKRRRPALVLRGPAHHLRHHREPQVPGAEQGPRRALLHGPRPQVRRAGIRGVRERRGAQPGGPEAADGRLSGRGQVPRARARAVEGERGEAAGHVPEVHRRVRRERGGLAGQGALQRPGRGRPHLRQPGRQPRGRGGGLLLRHGRHVRRDDAQPDARHDVRRLQAATVRPRLPRLLGLPAPGRFGQRLSLWHTPGTAAVVIGKGSHY